MKKHIASISLVLISLGIQAQIKINSNLATSALNSNVTKTVILKTVNNTTSGSALNFTNGMSTSMAGTAVSSLGSAGSGAYSVLNTRSKFGYYTPFYAQIITVQLYSSYYHNIPVHKYLPGGEIYRQYPTIALRDFNQFWPHYRYFHDGRPGFLPYQTDRPASIFIDIGITKPVPLQVDPSTQAYTLNNTRFVKSVTLTY